MPESCSLAEVFKHTAMEDRVNLVPGELHQSEKFFLWLMANQVCEEIRTDITIVNIGILHGLSCHCLRIGGPGARIVGIDILGDERMHDFPNRDTIEVIKADSGNYDFPDPIHLLFIDGDHETPAVRKDILKYCPKIVKNGYVIFHDARGRGRWESKVSDAIDDVLVDTGFWNELTYSTGRIVGVLRWFKRL